MNEEQKETPPTEEPKKPKLVETEVILDGEGAIEDWMRPKKRMIRKATNRVKLIRVKGATTGGRNGIAIAAILKDNSIAFLSVTERIFVMAAQAFATASAEDGTISPDLLDSGEGDIQPIAESEVALKKLRAWCEKTIAEVDEKIAKKAAEPSQAE